MIQGQFNSHLFLPHHDRARIHFSTRIPEQERILRFCLGQGRPWCLLMPNYVANKLYYTEVIKSLAAEGNAPFYIVRVYSCSC